MSEETENEQIAAALEAAQEKVSASRLIDDPAAPAADGHTSFDGGARPSSPPAESPEEAHQQFIADLLTGGRAA